MSAYVFSGYPNVGKSSLINGLMGKKVRFALVLLVLLLFQLMPVINSLFYLLHLRMMHFKNGPISTTSDFC